MILLALFSSAFASDGMNYGLLVKPILSTHTFTTNDDVYWGAKYGGALGVKYAQDKRGLKLMGQTRAQYVQTWAPKASGEELRVGSFIGPWWRIVGLQVGADWLQQEYVNPTVTMSKAQGVHPQISGMVDLRLIHLSASAGPIFYVSGDRQSVNWTTTDKFGGIGDEFAYTIQTGIDLLLMNFGINYQNRHTAYGTEEIFGISVSVF